MSRTRAELIDPLLARAADDATLAEFQAAAAVGHVPLTITEGGTVYGHITAPYPITTQAGDICWPPPAQPVEVNWLTDGEVLFPGGNAWQPSK